MYSDALVALQKPRSKAPAIVPEAEAPAEALEEVNENPEVQELIEQSRGMVEQGEMRSRLVALVCVLFKPHGFAHLVCVRTE